ncbi:formate dehydrogenase subunit gamma [Betaproteobacteria bacterium GR16-43]|nr:formate dehydrogenase subunit gamma [Betaproteobacteria bacterium GR16-43]
MVGACLLLPIGAMAQQAAAPGKAPEAAKPVAAAPAAPVPAPAASVDAPAPKLAPGSTAAPGWNVPPQEWDKVDRKPQYASVPGRETNVLIQGTGHEWRKFRNGPETFYGGILLLLPFAALLGFYLLRGPIKVHDPLTGRTIERFNGVERTTHWTMAISFVVLAFSGIVILFGKHIILPWLGHSAFSTVTIFSKTLHNFVGPLFIFALVIFIILFAKDNIPKAHDWQWIPKFGGMISGEHVPSGKFNAGEKALFWSLVAGLCVILSITGLILDFPNWNQSREAMQVANVVHGVCAIFAMAMACFHIYLGTIGMEGAYKAMKTGVVDETWAKEHHEIWYQEVKEGKRPEKIAAGNAQPATGD